MKGLECSAGTESRGMDFLSISELNRIRLFLGSKLGEIQTGAGVFAGS